MIARKVMFMREALVNQWLPPERISEMQFEKFSAMLGYAGRHVPFYRDKLAGCGADARDIKSREDILRLPVTTKKELYDVPLESRMSELFSPRDCRIEGTSGSGGMKLTVALDRRAKDFCDCVYGRALFALGYRPWEPMAYFWPQANHVRELHERLGLMRKDWICSHIGPEEQLAELVRLKPRIIYAFPSLLSVIAKIIEKDGRDRYPLNPDFIICHAELLHPETRAYIESVFGVPVYNEYGATEFGFRMAWECLCREGLHIDEDSVLIEFLGPDGRPVAPGQKGEMVVSGLVNRAMPLIRYRIGDIGVPSARRCSCGRGLALMERLEGRDDDFVVLPSGRVISPRVIVPIIEQCRQVGEFRFIQHERGRMEMLLVGCGQIGEAQKKEICGRLLAVFAEPVVIDAKVVASLERNDRGKLRAVVSRVERPSAR